MTPPRFWPKPSVLELLRIAAKEKRSVASLIPAVAMAQGYPVSERTISRWLLNLRHRSMLRRTAIDSSLAIAACEGDSEAMAKLASSIQLPPLWRAKREFTLSQSFKAFTRSPSTASLTELRTQSMIFLFESEFSRLVRSMTPPERSTTE